ncbi:LD-carboxypeptidase, partial [Vibrio cholerae]
FPVPLSRGGFGGLCLGLVVMRCQPLRRALFCLFKSWRKAVSVICQSFKYWRRNWFFLTIFTGYSLCSKSISKSKSLS